jgi:hypothetical protein
MKRIKVENISVMKLDFFLQQNKQDIRVVLSPGDISWCDEGSTTKSMILYERKNLIKTSSEEIPEHEYLSIEEEMEAIKERAKKALEEFAKIKIKNPPTGLIGNDLISVQPMPLPAGKIFTLVPIKTEPEKKDEEQNVEPAKEEKKYKGKKRGRKKKRGPKKGSKRNKGGDSESNNQQ